MFWFSWILSDSIIPLPVLIQITLQGRTTPHSALTIQFSTTLLRPSLPLAPSTPNSHLSLTLLTLNQTPRFRPHPLTLMLRALTAKELATMREIVAPNAVTQNGEQIAALGSQI